jgi:prepilin-type N-terminal cleavage/methylation domain-containing protein
MSMDRTASIVRSLVGADSVNDTRASRRAARISATRRARPDLEIGVKRARPTSGTGTDRASSRSGFTLLELLTSMAILGVMVVMLFSVFEQINKAWLTGENRVETFTDARAVLDLMSRELSQAITTTNAPNQITFYGDTHRVYFVAPVNTDPANQADLCEVGYEYVPGAAPSFYWEITRRLTVPSPANIGTFWDFYTDPTSWWDDTGGKSFPKPDGILASNTIVNLTFQYLDINGHVLATPYRSEVNGNRLPYAVVVALDAVDSRTATKLKLVGGPSTSAGQSILKPTLRSFTTTVYMPNTLP